ncbi:MAG: nitroreductase family protein [Gammaproteobacteria bacterium]
MGDERFVALEYCEYPVEEMRERAESFYREMQRRRSVRDFSSRPVDRRVIERCLLAAGTAPSGANMQPWTFVVVSDAEIKRRIRLAAEEEERKFYNGAASEEWLEALEPLGTNAEKPFLEEAPFLIVVFRQKWGVAPDGEKIKHYYVHDSVGIATGMLITALHLSGLATLTHTPSPMGFLNEVLDRPKNETATMILVVGYPKEGARVPNITRKSLDEIAVFV